VLCEHTEDGGKAINAYLSAFDAMLDAAYASTPGTPYHVVPAYKFDPAAFIAAHDDRLVVNVHLAWAAHGQRLILRRKGQLAACSTLQVLAAPAKKMHRIEFAIEKDILDVVDRLHEHAGLFAYREAHEQVWGWGEERRHRAVAKAIQTIPGTVDSEAQCDQLALYDAEFEQWHFLPRALLDDPVA
jgi:hypothetical protein